MVFRSTIFEEVFGDENNRGLNKWWRCSGDECCNMGVVQPVYYGMKVIGIRRGYNGLIYGDLGMDITSVGDIVHRGGNYTPYRSL